MVFRSLNLETNAFNCSASISIKHPDVCMNTREITAFIVWEQAVKNPGI